MDAKEYLKYTHMSNWDVSSVINTQFLFSGKRHINMDISRWDVSNVTDMYRMFDSNKLFNQDISRWDVSNVLDMKFMFHNTKSFDQDLSSWGDKLHPDVTVLGMFKGSPLEGNEPQWYLDKINKGK